MRTLCVTFVSTITSLVNISVLVALKFELGYLCLSLCSLDVLVDAVTLALMTNSAPDSTSNPRTGSIHTRTITVYETKSRRPSAAQSVPPLSPVVEVDLDDVQEVSTDDDEIKLNTHNMLDDEEKGSHVTL